MLACLFVPLFPLAARLRSEPDLKGEAAAVFEGNGNAARVLAATRKAREKGIQPGMTLPQARSLFPKLLARARDFESERAAQEALLEVADTFSPRVEDAGDGVVYLDLEGLPALARAPHAVGAGLDPARSQSRVGGRPQGPPLRHDQDESQREAGGRKGRPYGTENTETPDLKSAALSLARDIISAVEKASLPVRVGIATSKLAARIAAGLPHTPVVVPAGEEAAFLAPLPLSRLAPEAEIAETLARWGIRSVGDFARLPEGEVASRLGEIGRELHTTARGFDPRPLMPRLPPPDFTEGMDLEWPLVSLEPFLFVGNAALERLVARLEAQGLACVRLEASLRLDPDGCDARAIALPAPTREVKTLLTLVRLELEARPPGAPVTGFAFTAHPDRPRRAQLSLFGPAALSPDKLATTIARLAALLGAGRVGSPRTVDGHRPERFTEVSYAPPPPPSLARPPKTGRGLLSVRVLRPPVPLEVIVASSSDSSNVGAALAAARPGSRPISIRTLAPDAQPPISGSIKIASGPWAMEDGWWQAEATFRDYWDVELSDGALYRIYRDRKTDVWFADGIYD